MGGFRDAEARRTDSFSPGPSRRPCAGAAAVLAALLLPAAIASGRPPPRAGLRIENGWFVHDGRAVWGYAQHNGWWRAGQRPNLARRAPGEVGPNRTEDLDRLTDAMLRFGYPGFEHNFGLWYDRRRDAHDTARRRDAHAVPPFLEQPWARSGSGTAWDGLPRYDLTRFNDWYFERLDAFAALCDRKGTILFHNTYMQHALLETQAHYADFPWRPVNCIQDTGLPDRTPAASVFYDLSSPVRRRLHLLSIRKCLDTLGSHTNVVFLCSEEYTGPQAFLEFWLDTIAAWEEEKGRRVLVGLGGCKDVADAILAQPRRRARISVIDLRAWWYTAGGKLFAPPGGREVPGRFMFTDLPRVTPAAFHRQILEYRRRYPRKAIVHGIPGTRQHAWAALTAGGSMLIGQLPYPGLADPPEYIAPEACRELQPTYDFVRRHLARELPSMRPLDGVCDHPERNWCLGRRGEVYVVYALKGGALRVDLKGAPGAFRARWFDPRTGAIEDAAGGRIAGGGTVGVEAPAGADRALWLTRIEKGAAGR